MGRRSSRNRCHHLDRNRAIQAAPEGRHFGFQSRSAQRNDCRRRSKLFRRLRPASESQAVSSADREERQAQAAKKALSSRADNFAANRLVRPANPTSPAARAMHGAPSRKREQVVVSGPVLLASRLPKLRSRLRATLSPLREAQRTRRSRRPQSSAPSPSAQQAVEAPSSSQTVEVVQSAGRSSHADRQEHQVSDQLVEKQKELALAARFLDRAQSVLDAKNPAAAICVKRRLRLELL